MRRFVAQADRELVVGQRYIMEAVDEEQSARDRAYHASIRDAWVNLPESMAEQFSNATDFRRWLLVECGFCDVAKLAFASSKAANAALPFLQSGGAQLAVVGSVVVVKRPWSQKLRGGMDKETRRRSYRETQDLASSLIGVRPEDLQRESGRAA
jgi:hypothetical protein